jgi:hypothetical protein
VAGPVSDADLRETRHDQQRAIVRAVPAALDLRVREDDEESVALKISLTMLP